MFREQGLAEWIARALEEIGLPPQYLAVEITESHAMHNMEQTITTLRELDQVGVQLSIANFGFGYSSLNQLKCFPIDVLKIDRSLVRPLPEDNTALAIIRSIVDLGHGQGWKVFAEGVESPEQLDLLRAMDCDGVQGFYCGRPLPHTRITNLLQSGGRMPRRAAGRGVGAAALR
jgi:EAL domain-containing protein (putative c-di-GMP-specific phosphodiesterase class I)